MTLQKAGGTAKSVRVLVVDDHEAWRRFYLTTLQKRPELQVIGQAFDGSEAVHIAQEVQPDLILLDIGLPIMNGIEAARRIRKVSPASKILFISENRSRDIAEAALTTGAGGYVVKADAAGELLPRNIHLRWNIVTLLWESMSSNIVASIRIPFLLESDLNVTIVPVGAVLCSLGQNHG